MELFKEYPELEDDLILIHRLSPSDAPALASLAGNDKVYRFEPTFLYERKYKDSAYAIEHLDQECFETGQSMIMGVYLRSEPDVMVGLAEICNYEERKQKASIGYRLDERYWGRGIATRIAGLLKNYLMEKTDIRTITAHVMKENIPSAKVLMHNGFIDKYPDVYGDWGFKELTHTDKYVFKRSWMGREFGKTLKVDVEKFVLRFMTDSRKILESLPSGCTSLSPEIRINTEIRDDDVSVPCFDRKCLLYTHYLYCISSIFHPKQKETDN